MNEWYGQVHELILKESVTRENIAGAVAGCQTIRPREGMFDFLRSCQEHVPAIPVIIMSAGLGDVIEEFLRQTLPFERAPTTHVVSNRMVFNEEGRLVDFSEPLLHMFNKTAAFLPEACRELAKGKRQCLLMGDGVGDCTMANGLEVEPFKIGFLNEKIEERMPEFQQKFDVVVTGDAPVPELAFRAIGGRV
ncbi:NT5C3B [Symbiodinium natans]|uniref:5'-nucleotidase n=1 Tax=Symbiodinium natans TaxID=878477 RepID=A0A812IBS6_9DINO|nr:NT5C3B [Symbiodinium natans]